MRARLRKKLARRATLAKLRAAAAYAFAKRREQHPEELLAEAAKVVYWILFHADLEFYGWYGRPIFLGIRWVKTECGPRPAWARKERTVPRRKK